MGPAEKKRPLPDSAPAQKDQKRRKTSGSNGKSKASNGRPAKAKPERKSGLRAEVLDWHKVSMPDHLEDYEGFYGLEEVDDVEVIKNPDTGIMSFSARNVVEPSTKDPNEIPFDPGEAEDEPDENGDQNVQGEEEEWGGFSDDGDDAGAGAESQESEQENEAQPAKQKPEQKQKRAVKSEESNADDRVSGAFETLAAQNDDEGADISAWQPLQLSRDTLGSLSALGFGEPTPIQKAAIPEILAGHDVIGKASTGSGKTLAYGIPILEHFLEQQAARKANKDSREKTPTALILSPTRELAHQLDKHLGALCSSGDFQQRPSIATLTGGLSVQKQQRLLKHADIVIGTPGRLWEVIGSGQGLIEALKQIQYLVVDEADRLLSEGNFKEVEEILNALDRVDVDDEADNNAINNKDAKKNQKKDSKKAAKKNAKKDPSPEVEYDLSKPHRQTLVFSATFDRGLQKKLAGKALSSASLLSNRESLEYLLSKLTFHAGPKPKFIDVNPINQLASGLKESLVECAGTEKDLYLYTLLLLHPNTRTLIFTNSISAVRRLTPFLQQLDLPALALHSGMPQKARLRSIERFTAAPKNNQSSILVATDVAARGLDIPAVQLVLHYHLPRAADTYVHRSGRTARAGAPGSSVLICAPEEVAGVRRLVAKVHAHSAASAPTSAAGKQRFYIRTLDPDRRVVGRLKPRATLAKKIADTGAAKEKMHSDDSFLRAAAEELGVDYDTDEFDAVEAKGKRGRGGGRKKKQREDSETGKAELRGMKAELKGLLRQRVNVGVSERYLAGGAVDVDALLKQREEGGEGGFLGEVRGLGGLEGL